MIIPIVGPTYEQIDEQIEAALPLADLLEWRIDFFAPSAIKNLPSLRKKVTKPLIFTLRKKAQGGLFERSEEERKEVIASLLPLNPDYFDLEMDTFLDLGTIKRITSYHNFEKTPHNLDEILNEMKKIPSHLFKIATMALSTNDSLRMILLCQKNPNLFGQCMGEKGEITRILSKNFVFVCLDEKQKSAPGQLTVEEYKTYRKRGEKLYGLIGTQVSQSISHLTHNKLMQDNALDSVYVKMIVEKQELAEFFKLIKEVGFQGLSVTIALKEYVASFLDWIDEEAQRIGAVNTIWLHEGKLHGFNTDGQGALDAIEEKTAVKNKRVVVLGAGGAARAIIFEALKRGAKVVVINRTQEKAKALAAEFDIEVSQYEENYDILINTTPDEMPIAETMIVPKSFVMDIKTKPKMTALMKCAQEKQCILIYGYEMFMNQALRQFQIWFRNKDLKIKSFKDEILRCVN